MYINKRYQANKQKQKQSKTKTQEQIHKHAQLYASESHLSYTEYGATTQLAYLPSKAYSQGSLISLRSLAKCWVIRLTASYRRTTRKWASWATFELSMSRLYVCARRGPALRRHFAYEVHIFIHGGSRRLE